MTREEAGGTVIGMVIHLVTWVASSNVDIVLGVILKLLSILSVTFVIIVNLPKVVSTIRTWLRKK